jgi:hypothetical protein
LITSFTLSTKMFAKTLLFGLLGLSAVAFAEEAATENTAEAARPGPRGGYYRGGGYRGGYYRGGRPYYGGGPYGYGYPYPLGGPIIAGPLPIPIPYPVDGPPYPVAGPPLPVAGPAVVSQPRPTPAVVVAGGQPSIDQYRYCESLNIPSQSLPQYVYLKVLVSLKANLAKGLRRLLRTQRARTLVLLGEGYSFHASIQKPVDGISCTLYFRSLYSFNIYPQLK